MTTRPDVCPWHPDSPETAHRTRKTAPHAVDPGSPFDAARRVLRGHDGMDPSGVTCLGCGAHLAEPTGNWKDAAAALNRHHWDLLLAQNSAAVTEHAVEVIWLDPVEAGAVSASGTTLLPGITHEDHLKRLLDSMRRDSDVAATRVLTRRAAYTPWEGGAADPTTPEERERLLTELYAEAFPHLAYAGIDPMDADTNGLGEDPMDEEYAGELEYIDCTCGHPRDDHHPDGCGYTGCGCHDPGPAPRPDQKDHT